MQWILSYISKFVFSKQSELLIQNILCKNFIIKLIPKEVLVLPIKHYK